MTPIIDLKRDTSVVKSSSVLNRYWTVMLTRILLPQNVGGNPAAEFGADVSEDAIGGLG